MAAGMRNAGRIPPRCFRRRFRRWPQFMMSCLTDPRDSALVFFYILALARPRVIIVIVIQRGRGRIGGGGRGHPGTSLRLFGGDSGTSTGGRHRRGGGPCPCTDTAVSGEEARWGSGGRGGGDGACSGGRNGSRSAGGSRRACSGGRDGSGLTSSGDGRCRGGRWGSAGACHRR